MIHSCTYLWARVHNKQCVYVHLVCTPSAQAIELTIYQLYTGQAVIMAPKRSRTAMKKAGKVKAIWRFQTYPHNHHQCITHVFVKVRTHHVNITLPLHTHI